MERTRPVKPARLAALALVLFAGCGREAPLRGAAEGWPTWGGPPGGSRFSPLEDVTRENVHRLEVAWIFRTGDYDPTGKERTSFQATPVLHGRTLYFCSPFNRVFAVDAERGDERWVFDPEIDRVNHHYFTCRGVAVREDATLAAGAACRTTVYLGTNDMRLFALDAANGAPCAEFGDGGVVDLREGIGELAPGEMRVTSPPTVIRDVVAVGALVSDNKRVDAPGGVVRGFDARTGALRWAFDPVAPGTPPVEPNGDGRRYHRGTPNAWGVFSADAERDLLFVPTGNPSNDFYRGGRDGVDYYGSSVVALRGATGEVAWRFQTVHHDLWDYDVGAQPTLGEVRVAGRPIAAVIQPTKVGHVFILDRETGEPLFPVEERPVPPSDVPGEVTSPTQPFPTNPEPLHSERLRNDDVFGLTFVDGDDCRTKLRALRNEGPFTPPSLAGSLEYPGVAGGVNWGGAAFDAERQLLFVTQTRLGMVQRLVPADEVDRVVPHPPREILFPQRGAPYGVLQSVFMSSFGMPCTPPPWSELIGIGLEPAGVRWRVPFGTTRGQAPFPFWLAWGTPGMGGPIVTRSHVLFIGAALDGYVRAYDAYSGEELWRDHLPAGGQATPMTYRARDGGRQYLVIAAGGHATLGTEIGDYLIAWALPEDEPIPRENR